MRTIIKSLALVLITTALFSCSKESTIAPLSEDNPTASQIVLTKAISSLPTKTMKIVGYVETNSANPLNALDYYMVSGTDSCRVFDIVNIFAANLHVDLNGDPCVYFNPELAAVMNNLSTYIQPLQAAGIKVVLTLLPDWKDMGLCSMTATQAQMLAEIIAYILDYYGLDGIDLDDEYEGNNNVPIANSYGNLIKALRPLLDDLGNKLITVFDYGHTSQIDATAGGYIDYAYCDFSPYYLDTTSSISGMTYDRWAPLSINLSNSYSSYICNYFIKPNAGTVKTNGYAATMLFNLHESGVSPDPWSVIKAVVEGAYGITPVRIGGNRARNAGSVSGGLTITYDDI